MDKNPYLDKTHKYQPNERVLVNIPSLGFRDSQALVITRIEKYTEGQKPQYQVLVNQTRGVYRVDEDMLSPYPVFVTSNPDHDVLERCSLCDTPLELRGLNGETILFKAHTDIFCKKTMKSTIDMQRLAIKGLQDHMEEFSRTHVSHKLPKNDPEFPDD